MPQLNIRPASWIARFPGVFAGESIRRAVRVASKESRNSGCGIDCVTNHLENIGAEIVPFAGGLPIKEAPENVVT
jgi:hypothetical protein